VAVIPNDPECRIDLSFRGVTATTLIRALKKRIDEENGGFNGDTVSGNIERETIQGETDIIYRIVGDTIQFFVTKKSQFVECSRVKSDLRQMVDGAVAEARANINPTLEFEDDDDEIELPSFMRPLGEPDESQEAPAKSEGPTAESLQADDTEAVEKGEEADKASGMRRKLIIGSVVGIVAIAGLMFLRNRAPKET
jgi:hypothetical protein